MTPRTLIAVGTCAAVFAGCGDDGSSGGGSASARDDKAMAAKEAKAMKQEKAMKEEKAMAARKGTTVEVVDDSRFGRILADRRGQAFYLFAKEKSKRSRCYGACARAWPPVLNKAKPRAGEGARGRLLGTTKRRGGKTQVTYRGRPLYYYTNDSPGRVLCHNVHEFGGLWLVVKPNGRPVS
jgi:predicted lipoprotein with Yx(FWY)xxD motif